MGKYSIAMIKESYAQKKDWEKQFPTNYYIFRPLSFYLTYFVIKLTESPSCVAWVGFFIGISGCLCFSFAPYITMWPGIVLLFVFAILDAVDGNIARVTGKVTYYGKFLDGALGEVIEGGCWLWLGWGLYSLTGGPLIILSGAVAMFGRLSNGIFQRLYYTNLMRMNKEQGTFKDDIHASIASSVHRKKPLYLLFANLNVFTLQLLLLVLFVSFGKGDLFLFLFASYFVFRLLVMIIFYSYQARKNLM